jgi:hypothetical protein
MLRYTYTVFIVVYLYCSLVGCNIMWYGWWVLMLLRNTPHPSFRLKKVVITLNMVAVCLVKVEALPYQTVRCWNRENCNMKHSHFQNLKYFTVSVFAMKLFNYFLLYLISCMRDSVDSVTLSCVLVTILAMETQQYVPFYCGLHVAVSNIKVFSVVMEMQQWVPFALLSSCKIFHTAL